MANTQATFGFKHIGYLSGSGVDYQISTAPILSSYTTKIYFGEKIPSMFSSSMLPEEEKTGKK